jgi:hypothetical protein
VAEAAAGLGAQVEGVAGGVAQMAMQFAGLGSAATLISTIADSFQDAKRSALDATKFVQEYRQALLELANLKGMGGRTTEALREEVAFRGKTLQTPDAARAFQLAALGVGEASVDTPTHKGAIARDEWRKALEMAGSFQAFDTGDPTAHGTLIGTLANLTKGRTTGAELFAREQQLYKVFQPGGFSFASGAQQYARLAPLIQSGLLEEQQAGALLSAFSIGDREGAGEKVQQFMRATLGGVGQKGRVMVEGGTPRGQYYKGLGISPESIKGIQAERLPFEIANRIMADLAGQERGAAGRGEEFNAYTYLRQHGMANQEEVNALLAYRGLQEGGQLPAIMQLAAPGAGPGAAAAMGPIEEAQRKDLRFQGIKAELSGQFAQLAVGAGPQEVLANMRRAAYSRMFADKKLSGTFEENYGRSFWNPRDWLMGEGPGAINMEAQRGLVREAGRLGITEGLPQKYGPGPEPEFMGEAGLFNLASKVQAAGGDVTGGALDQTSQAADRQLQAAQAFERGVDKMEKILSPALPSAPAVMTR